MKFSKISGKKQENKLEKLYLTYRDRMYISAYKVLKDPMLAEDAVHDAFIAIARNLDKINSDDCIKTTSYVIKAAKNTALNMLKKDSATEVMYINTIDISSDERLLDRLCDQCDLDCIVNAIMSLDEKYRDVLSLYYLNELTVNEIADILSRKTSTVKQQLVRGRQKLIAQINKEVLQNEEK